MNMQKRIVYVVETELKMLEEERIWGGNKVNTEFIYEMLKDNN